jgi:cytochrome c-type biogenesis protein CcmH/NrfF
MRQRIYQMKMTGMTDRDVIDTIVREEGVVALAAPPTGTFGGVITWVTPAVALLIGFWIYSTYVRKNRQAPQPLSEIDRAALERFGNQLDPDLDESPGPANKSSPDLRT